MDKQTKQQAILQRLHGLAGQPGTQVHYALELLDQECGNQGVSAALDIVPPLPFLRLDRYYCGCMTIMMPPASSATRAAVCTVRSWEHCCPPRQTLSEAKGDMV
jgi:hypothetical protein